MFARFSRLHTGAVGSQSGRCSGQPFCQKRGPSTPSVADLESAAPDLHAAAYNLTIAITAAIRTQITIAICMKIQKRGSSTRSRLAAANR
jgi:hypothetical protein